jgi:hypothetical protein
MSTRFDSPKLDAWGEFGPYIEGTMNPFLHLKKSSNKQNIYIYIYI